MERSTIFHGKTHYFDWAIFNSKLSIYRRVSFFLVKKWIFNDLNWILSDKKQDIGEQVEMKCILTLANKIRTGTGF